MVRHVGGASSASGVPIRADMATTVAGPQGIMESASLHGGSAGPSAQTMKRRDEMKGMLVRRLQSEFGNDPVRAALVKFEVERFPPLKAGTMTRDDLARLESTVKEAVKVADAKSHSGMPIKSMPPKRDMARDVEPVACWTKVAGFQAGFVNVAQQQFQVQKAQRKEELREQLAHQRFEQTQKRRAADAEKKKELDEMNAMQAQYAKEDAEVAARRAAKLAANGRDRADQVGECEARRAVDRRLQQLEDLESQRKFKAEEEAKMEENRQRILTLAEKNAQSQREFAEVREQRNAAKQAEMELEAKLNKEWKAILDKQEADRLAHIDKLKSNIFNNQRTYEDIIGKKMREQAALDEERRKKYIEDYEAQQTADDLARKTKRLEMLAHQTSVLGDQIAHSKEQSAKLKAAERQNALRLNEEAVKEEQREATRIAEARARALVLQHEQGTQIVEKRKAGAASTKMTALEKSMNQDLLHSILDESYHKPSLLV